jgi:NAD(P)-dependent dehydrogenase (short-subunit alcohol dehydrogenase family)
MQTALVTGSNSGIGRATALRLAASGYRVYAAMRDTAKAEKLLDFAKREGIEVAPIALDVTDASSIATAVGQILATAGGVDILVNNAGIGMNATTEDIDIEKGMHVFDTNYWGCVRCIQAVLPGMREQSSGLIINVSSIAGRIAALAQTVYASSKWALECLSENLAQEVAPFGVRVAILEPGVARTAILPKNLGHPEPTAYAAAYRRMLQFYKKGIEANIPAEQVAQTVLTAIEDPTPRLRYSCAWGGEELPTGRDRMSDEEWVEMGSAATDDDYYDVFQRRFGLDLRTDD